MVREQTKIWIYDKTPFRNDYENVINFDNVEEMNRFFETDSKHINHIYYADDFQQLGRNGEVYVEGRVEKFENATYMRFQNNGRMMYAFIFDVVYQTENTTQIIYEIDVYNTYQLELHKSRVQGTVEQATLKNNLQNLKVGSQGFGVGTKIATLYGEIDTHAITWLVIVAKPSFKTNNSNDSKELLFSFNGIQSSLKYFVLPFDIRSKKSLDFEYNGKTYKGGLLRDILATLYGLDKSTGAVNNIINIYTSRHIGINYTVENGLVKISNELQNFNIEAVGNMDTAVIRNNAGGFTAVSETGTDNEGRIKDFVRAVKANIPNATVNGISAVVGGFQAESNTNPKRYEGDYATGYKYDLVEKEPTAENLLGSWGAFAGLYNSSPPEHRPNASGYLVNGKHWIGIGLGQWTGPRTKALFDFAKSKNLSIFSFSAQIGFMLTESRANQLLNVITSNEDINTLTERFLATWLGVPGNKLAYRQAEANKWKSVIESTLNENTNTQPQAQQKDTTQVLKALQEINNRRGQTVGNGECYGLVALYSSLLGGAKLGGGVTGVEPNGNGRQAAGSDTRRGMSASNIGGDYDWNSYGWAVKFDPRPSDFKAGTIINYKNENGYATGYGHTAVVIEVNENGYKILEQNYGGRYVTSRSINGFKHVESLVYPSDLIDGTVNFNDSVTGAVNGDYTAINRMSIVGYLLQVVDIECYTSKTYAIGNVLQNSIKMLKDRIKNLVGYEDIEYQLLNSEFLEFEIFDMYGNSYIYQPQLMPFNELDKSNYIVMTGSVANSNQVFTGLLDYNREVKRNDLKENVLSRELYELIYKDAMRYGYNDLSNRDITILNDAVASWIQGNKYQNQALQLNFKENRDMQQQQADLSTRQVAQANKEASYNADYSVKSAEIGTYTAGANAIANTISAGANGLLTGGLFGMIGGATSAGAGGALNTYNAYRGWEHAEKLQGFTNENNMLRSQANNLSSISSKMALNQSERSYNAVMKDRENQPTSVQQLGTDLSFQTGNKIDALYYRWIVANNEVLKRAYNYIKNYGVLVNEYYDNVLTITNNRLYFNYIKCSKINIFGLSVNQAHLNTLEAIFISGVRIWRFSELQWDRTLFNTEQANPNKD